MKLFTFFDENTNITHTIEILGPDDMLAKIEEDEYEFLDLVIQKIDERNLESLYGVHDISYTRKDAILGFVTYEVHAHKWNALMKIWKDILTELGLRVGKYYKK